jgi:type I restriction enzyme S subunit
MSKEFYELKKIPSNWNITKLKYILSFSDEISTNYKKEINLSLTKKGIIEKNIVTNEGQIANSYKEYIFTKKGQISMNPMDLLSGWVDIAPTDGIISPAYYTFITNKNFDTKFINYFLQSNYYRKTFFKLGKGIASHDNYGRWVLTPYEFNNIYFFYPNLEIQKIISDYLDKKTQKIDFFIKKIEKKVKLLKEKRLSIINTCITKGLNSNAEMKDSKIDWIGKIPKHWKVTKLKYHGSVIIGLTFDDDDIVQDDTGVLVLRSSNVQKSKVSFLDNVRVKSEIPKELYVQNGDILICSRNGSRDLIGKNCILGKESLGMSWGVFMSVFRSKSPKFFYWMLNSQVFKSQSGLYLTSTINQLTVSTLENLKFPYVSDPTEQKEIDDYLTNQTVKIDKLINNELRKIELLTELRQSLISNIVTGKTKMNLYN